jgi:hypothetical protein
MDFCTQVPTARRAWCLWPCSVGPSSKCRRFLRPWHVVKSMQYWKFLDRATGCSGPSLVGEGGRSGRQVAKYRLPTSTVMRERDGVDCFRVHFFLGW